MGRTKEDHTMNRYTINGLLADVRIANRALLDAPKPGSYFYTIGHSYGRTQLYASRIELDGNVSQFDQIESGTPRECLAGMHRRNLAGYCHPEKRINRQQAAGMLRVCSDIMTHGSSDTVGGSDMETAIGLAHACKYRKPANFPGSLGRAFWESCNRAARQESAWQR